MGDSRRRWSPEFKRDAVALVRSSGRPISDIARELGCGSLTRRSQCSTANDRAPFSCS